MKFTYKVKDGYHCSSVTIRKDKIEITFDEDNCNIIAILDSQALSLCCEIR